MIHVLPEDARSHLRSGVATPSIAQCVEELVLNSVDAGATCVAVRVDVPNCRIQVVDNGIGITQEELDLVGQRYATSKCHHLKDLEHLKYFGYRGEALASISNISGLLEIVSRAKESDVTLSKLFKDGETTVFEASRKRPSVGTTVTVHSLFHSLPVRRKMLSPVLDYERVCRRIEGLALIHPGVSFTLRDDTTAATSIQTHVTSSLVNSFRFLFGKSKASCLREIEHESSPFNLRGYIGVDGHANKNLQFIYVNSRLVLKTRLHKAVNYLLRKSMITRHRLSFGDHDRKTESSKMIDAAYSPGRTVDHYGIFVLNIKCPPSEYDICLEPSKMLVEFKNWNGVLECVQRLVEQFLSRENLTLKIDKSLGSPRKHILELGDGSSQEDDNGDETSLGNSEADGRGEPQELSLAEKYGRGISAASCRSILQSLTVKRLHKLPAALISEEGQYQIKTADCAGDLEPERHNTEAGDAIELDVKQLNSAATDDSRCINSQESFQCVNKLNSENTNHSTCHEGLPRDVFDRKTEETPQHHLLEDFGTKRLDSSDLSLDSTSLDISSESCPSLQDDSTSDTCTSHTELPFLVSNTASIPKADWSHGIQKGPSFITLKSEQSRVTKTSTSSHTSTLEIFKKSVNDELSTVSDEPVRHSNIQLSCGKEEQVNSKYCAISSDLLLKKQFTQGLNMFSGQPVNRQASAVVEMCNWRIKGSTVRGEDRGDDCCKIPDSSFNNPVEATLLNSADITNRDFKPVSKRTNMKHASWDATNRTILKRNRKSLTTDRAPSVNLSHKSPEQHKEPLKKRFMTSQCFLQTMSTVPRPVQDKSQPTLAVTVPILPPDQLDKILVSADTSSSTPALATETKWPPNKFYAGAVDHVQLNSECSFGSVQEKYTVCENTDVHVGGSQQKDNILSSEHFELGDFSPQSRDTEVSPGVEHYDDIVWADSHICPGVDFTPDGTADDYIDNSSQMESEHIHEYVCRDDDSLFKTSDVICQSEQLVVDGQSLTSEVEDMENYCILPPTVIMRDGKWPATTKQYEAPDINVDSLLTEVDVTESDAQPASDITSVATTLTVIPPKSPPSSSVPNESMVSVSSGQTVSHRLLSPQPAEVMITDISGTCWSTHYDAKTKAQVYINLKTGNCSVDMPVTGGSTHDDNTLKRMDNTAEASSAIIIRTGRGTSHLHRQHSLCAEPFLASSSTLPGVSDVHLSPTSHDALINIVDEHMKRDVAIDSKWRGDCPNEQTGGGDSTVELLANWANPMFHVLENDIMDVQSSRLPHSSILAQNMIHPYRFTKAIFQDIKVLGQVDNKFIACMVNTGDCHQATDCSKLVVLIDQHAAHERIRLEELTADIFEDAPSSDDDYDECSPSSASRSLLIKSSSVSPPVSVSFPNKQLRLLRAFQDKLKKLGISYRFVNMGNDQCEDGVIEITRLPACLVEREAAELKRGREPVAIAIVESLLLEHVELLHGTSGASAVLPRTISKVLSSQACHGAIKFGDKLDRHECLSLIGQLSSCDLPFQCAHGRPSLVPLFDMESLHSKLQDVVAEDKPRLRLHKLTR